MRTPYIYIIGIALLLSACSSTSHLPEGELLYEGIGKITYSDVPQKQSKRQKRANGVQKDSTGVIIALADAAETLQNILAGRPREAMTASEQAKLDSLTLAAYTTPADFATPREEVGAVLAYAPNNAIFGSSSYHWPLRIGLWVHNAMAEKEGKFAKWMLKAFGTQPVLISQVAPDTRAKVAQNTLRNYGFFSGQVENEVYTLRNPRKAKINYTVRAGLRHHLDSIAYLGFPLAIDTLLRHTMPQSKLKKGEGFSAANLAAERTRIEALLREQGFYFFTADAVTFRADTLQRRGFVQLQVRPSTTISAWAQHPWYIGRTFVSCRRNATEEITPRPARRYYSYAFGGEKMPLRASMFRRASAHRHGEAFSLTDRQTTLSRLGTLGVFSSIDVSYQPTDTTTTCDTLDVYINTVMDKLYDSTLEVNATLKSNQLVGPGISYELAKRNAFGGAETVAWKIFGSYEWQTGGGSHKKNSLLNSYELGTSLSLKFPRLLGLRSGYTPKKRPASRAQAPSFPTTPRKMQRQRGIVGTTSVSLDADWRNRAGFFQMFTGGASYTYNWQRFATTTHEWTPLAIDFDHMMTRTEAFNEILQRNPALAVSMRDHFVPSLSYTYTYNGAAAHHRNPIWLQLSIKEAGALTSAGFAAAGRSFQQKDKRVLGNPFAQYVRLTAEAHQTYRFTPSIHLAARLFAGAVWAYGNSTAAPYYDQFYVGGANSIRAFTVRSLGPGAYRSVDTNYSYVDQTGDFKLEANLELRARLIGSLHGAVFLDAGNVWLLRDDPARPDSRLSGKTLKHIALGTGAGLRYDLDFFVLRFDVGIGLHAPYSTRRTGFYNIERFRDGLGLHLAIGYPF